MKSIITTITAALLLALLTPKAAAQSLNSEEYMRCVAEADSLALLERWDESASALRRALHAEPANPANQMLLANMGRILTLQGKYGDAVTHLNAALALNPGSFTAYKHRGVAFTAMHRLEDAAADFTAALAIDSLDCDVRCLRATVYACARDFDKAQTDYAAVLALDRDNPTALEGMATCCIARERHDDAIPFLNRLIEQKPDPDHYFTRGLALARLGRLSEASLDASEGLLLAPANGNLWLLRAYVEKLSYRLNDANTSLLKARKFGADAELKEELLPDL